MCFCFVPFMLYERLQFYGWHINTKCTVLSHNGKFSSFLLDSVFQRPWRESTGNNLQWRESLGSSGHLRCVDELNNYCGQKGKNRSFKEGNTHGTFRVILTDWTMDKSKVQCGRKGILGSFFCDTLLARFHLLWSQDLRVEVARSPRKHQNNFQFIHAGLSIIAAWSMVIKECLLGPCPSLS